MKKVDEQLATHGACARFGIGDGYVLGPREIIFIVLEEFAGVEGETGCQLVPKKYKFFIPNEGVLEDTTHRHLIPESLRHMQEGIHINNTRERVRGLCS